MTSQTNRRTNRHTERLILVYPQNQCFYRGIRKLKEEEEITHEVTFLYFTSYTATKGFKHSYCSISCIIQRIFFKDISC